jgi:guanylate kinase
MATRLLLLLGTSGDGKSSLIGKLKRLDSRFVHLPPYVTRETRKGETDRVHISHIKLDKLKREGKLLIVNKIYGGYYGTRMDQYQNAIKKGNFPILECPVTKVRAVRRILKRKDVFSVYVEPENLEVLKTAVASKEDSDKRYKASRTELEELHNGDYKDLIDFHIVNKQGELDDVAKAIRKAYLK